MQSMPSIAAVLVFLAVWASSSAAAEATNPLARVLDFMDSLTAKITKEGETEATAYKKFSDWCDSAAQNTKFLDENSRVQKGKA